MLDTIYSADNTNATTQTGEPSGSCFGDGSLDATIWFYFVAIDSGIYRTSTDFAGGTNIDTQLGAYSSSGGCSGTLTEIGCDEDGGNIVNWNSIMDFTAFAGDTVWIQVDGWNNPPPVMGTFSIQTTLVSSFASPANDDICNAQATVLDTIYNGNNSFATNQPGEPWGSCFGDGSVDASVWYYLVAPVSGIFQTSTDFGGATNTDTQLAAYLSSGGCGGFLNQIACDEDGGSIVNWNSIMEFAALAGDTVWIQVDGWNGPPPMVGSFQIQTTLLQAFTTSPNDSICNAQLMELDTIYPGHNVFATTELSEPVGSCFGDGSVESSVWYYFIAPDSGIYQTSTDFAGASNTNTQIAAYRSSGFCNGTLTEIGCDENSGVVVNQNSIMTFNAFQGDTIFIQVDGWSGLSITMGTFEIQTIYLHPAGPPANDFINTAQPMLLDSMYRGYNIGATVTPGEPSGTCFFDQGIESSVWYYFIAPQNGVYQTSTDFPWGTNDDTQLVAYSVLNDCNFEFEEIGCDDDGGTIVIYNSIMNFYASTGQEVWIQVDGWFGTEGTFDIQTTLLQSAGQYNASLDNSLLQLSGIGGYELVPGSQYSNGEVEFYVDVKNIGSDSVTGVTVSGNIIPAGQMVTGGISSIKGNGKGTVKVDSLLASDLTSYASVFSVSTNETDADPTNNNSNFNFSTGSLSDTVFARENEVFSSVDFGFSSTGRLGNTYRFTEPDTITSISVFFGGDLSGKTFELFISDFSDGQGNIELWNSGALSGFSGGNGFFTFSTSDFIINPGLYLIGVNQVDNGVSIDVGLTTAVLRPNTSFSGFPGSYCSMENLGDPNLEGTFMIRPNVKPVQVTSLFGKELVKKSFNMYPNPSSGDLTIEIENKNVQVVKIINSLGREILIEDWNGAESMNLDLKELPSGFYFVVLESENGKYSQKLTLR